MSKEQIFNEIQYVLRRNMNEEYLRKMLTRALILEELMHRKEATV